jgi:divalent metal cation (Fe/Co/Zn/Cd) transporter
VFTGLVLVWVTGDHLYDPIVALLLAAYLVWTAFSILRSGLSELLDTSLPDETVAMIEECLRHEGHGMRGFHALRTRKSGRETYIDVHALVDPQLSVSEAHRLVETLESDLVAAIPGAVVSVHVDPDEPGIMERHAHAAKPASRDTGLNLHLH